MSLQSDNINLKVIINGDAAGKTLKELNSEKRSLNDQLNKLNIGTKEWNETLSKLKDKTAQINGIKNEIKGVGDAMEQNKPAMSVYSIFSKNISVAGVNVSDLTAKLGEKKKALGGVTSAFGSVRNAIIATGIGALILAITAVVAVFKRTEEGAEKLERIMGGLGAAFDVIIGLVTDVGSALISIFTEPTAAFAKFVDFIAHPIDGIKKMGSAVAETAKQAINAASAQAALTGELQKLDDAEREVAKTLSKNQTEIDKLIIQSKNRTITEKERIDMLDKASKLENQNLAMEQEGSNKRVSIIERQNALKKKAGVLRDEDEDKFKDAILKRDQLERDSLVLQEKIINRKDALQDAVIKKQEQVKEKHKKLLEEIDKLEEQAYLKSLGDDMREVETIRIKYQKLYEQAAGHKGDLIRLQALEAEELSALAKKSNEKLALDKQKLQDKIFLLTRNKNDKEIVEESQKWEEIILEAERAGLDVTALHQMQADAIIEITKKQHKTEVDSTIDKTNKQISAEKRARDAKIGMAQQVQIGLSAIAELAAQNGAESAEFAKAMALFQIGINTAASISAGIAGATYSATATGPAAFVATPIFIASTIATILGAMAQASKVLTESPAPKAFAQGGPSFVKGGPVKKPFMALAGEAGPEWIGPNWMIEDPKLAPIFDILENIRTSKTYAAGGPTTTQTPAPAFTPSTNTGGSVNGELLIAVRQLTSVLQGGIAAVFDFDYYKKALARAEAAKSSATIGKS